MSPDSPKQNEINKKRRKIHEATVKKIKETKLLKKQRVKQELVEHEKEKIILEQRKVERNMKKEVNEKKPKKLGKEKLPEKDIEVLLTEQLHGSLREVNPTTSLLEDRFYSLQKRNIIEPRSAKDYERRYKMKLVYNIRQREFMNEQLKKI